MDNYSKEQVQNRLAQPNGSQNIDIEPAWEGAWQLLAEGSASALALFVRAAKQEKYARLLNEQLGDRKLLWSLLQSEEPKVRKNAARLAGALACDADCAVLAEALRQEETRMVRPSLILALGAMQTEEAQQVLTAYTVTKAQSPSEEKHVKEEKQALMTARASYVTTVRHTLKAMPRNLKAELRCVDAMEEVLIQELDAMAMPARKLGRGRVGVQLTSPKALNAVRTWRELLFPILAGVRLDAKAAQTIGEAAGAKLLRFLELTHTGEPPYAYRIEIRGQEVDRGKMAREIASVMDNPKLVNAPSAYESEIRVEVFRNTCNVYMKLYTFPDTRFAYRKGAVSASIHPATAAGIMRLAAEYFQPGARVLDPCCGSGTMLIERALYDTCSKLTGVDIASSAIRIAQTNMEAAGLEAELLTKNCTRFEARERYDEVISNLPFGNRVGNHETNVELYQEMLKKLPKWLKRGGTAILYTMELQLLEELLMKHRATLSLERIIRTEAGGLQPGIFIVKCVDIR